jgi:hypothetical protein
MFKGISDAAIYNGDRGYQREREREREIKRERE